MVLFMNKWQTYKKLIHRIPWVDYGKSVVRFIFVCLLIAAIWRTYEKPLLDAFGTYILPVLALFKANIWNKTLVYFASVILLYIILYRNVKHHYQYNPHLILFLCWCAIILGYYRLQESYNYAAIYGRVAFVDVLIMFCCITIIAAVVNGIIAFITEIRLRMQERLQEMVLFDNPICTLDEDELDWSDEVGKLLGVIHQLHKSQPISIAINAQWGAGKTSFLKILQSAIDRNRYEVVYFNPRESKTASEIQEDFFQQLITALSKYNGAAEINLKKYMQALQVIDDKNWITKILNIYAILNKESYRDKIKRICDKLPVKVIIIIDDFDRLLPDEILEVLKLINTNATFSNFIFLTAYDKSIVNSMLEKLGKTEDAYFTDKYFDLEYSLPIRAYKYIQDYFVNNLCSTLHLNEKDTDNLKQSVEAHVKILEENIPTLRDAKRLINQIILDYHLVEGEVDVVEFVYVQIIKYKYPAEYKALSKKVYLSVDFSTYCLSEEDVKALQPACAPLLEVLFKMKEEDYKTEPYRHIFSKSSFDIYFVNTISGSLRIRDMRRIFEVEYDELRHLIDGWIRDGHAEDFSYYLQSMYINTFPSKQIFYRYAEAATYLLLKTAHTHGDAAFRRCLYVPVLKEIPFLDLPEYKKHILSIIGDESIDPYYFNLRTTHYYYAHRVFDEEGSLIKDADIWPLVKERFLGLIKEDNIPEPDAIDYIQQCVAHLDEEKKSVLDKECCVAYRSYLDRHPRTYMETFVRQKYDVASFNWNHIDCNPYYLQIFESDENFISYVKVCIENNVPKSRQVLNFLKLYIANEHTSIAFRYDRDIKELLDSDFSIEVEQLEQSQSKNRSFEELLKDEKMQGNVLRLELQKMYIEVQSIDLPVAYRDKLYKMLKQLVES